MLGAAAQLFRDPHLPIWVGAPAGIVIAWWLLALIWLLYRDKTPKV